MLNWCGPIRYALSACLLFIAISAAAQRDDWHMFSRDIFVKSAFAHGYMHGYEQGFHNGDVDLQMGRGFRDTKTQAEFKKPVGYHPQFGDKSLFEDGYRNGFLVGYTDSFFGRNFRAAQLLEHKGTQLANGDAHFDHTFDRAFRDGYTEGRRQGLSDGRGSEVARLEAETCQTPPSHGTVSADYCDAFRTGYKLGYSDGFANQRGTADVFARNAR